MKRVDFNRDWEFQWGEPSNIPMMPAQKVKVDLPHDFMIGTDVSKDAAGESETGFYEGATGSYTKILEITEEACDRIHILSFDGCSGNTKIVVNGHTVFRHHYGYTPFEVELDRFLHVGSNRITVTAGNTNEPNSRWYSGAGLYRKVSLLTGEKVHIVPNRIYTYTKEIEGSALQVVETTVKNETESEKSVKLKVEIVEKKTGSVVAEATDVFSVEKKSCEVSHVEVRIENPLFWNVDTPELYLANVIVEETEHPEMCDSDNVQFGIRKICVDAKNGFVINDKPMKLKGGCIHHDNGIVGAAAFRDSEYRKVMLHKKAGFNALRLAHNPASKELLNACDEIGMLVIEEAFDVWNMEKDYYDFSNYFEHEWETELSQMILRDRNHPCIFMWSIGNELPEQGGLSNGYETSEKLAAFTKKTDPTRYVGGALCSFFRGLDDTDNEKYWKSVMENAAAMRENGMVNLDCEFGQQIWDSYTAPFVKDWDIVGYNYLQYQYEPSHAAHPERVICCTESKPREFGSYWADVERLPYVIGDFEWTSMDYIGEAGIGNSFYAEPEQVPQMRQTMFRAQYPARTAEAGEFDICGFEKPQIGYKKCVWGSDETFLVSYDPQVHDKVELLGRYGWGKCERSWSWPVMAGVPIKVEVYSRAVSVEVIVNGKSLGRKPAGQENDFRAVFETTYEPGVITAVSYDMDGNEISRDEQRTVGKPEKLTVYEDETLAELRARGILPTDEEAVKYLVIEVTDAEGNLVPYAEQKVTAQELGVENIIALGTGRPTTEENYTSGEITTYRGQALVIVR